MASLNWLFDVVDHAQAGMTPIPLPNAYAPARGTVVPTHRAEALIAYLASLKQPPWEGTEAGSGGPAMADIARPTTTASAPASASPAAPRGGFDAAQRGPPVTA